MAYVRGDYRSKWRIESHAAKVRASLGLDQIEVLDPNLLCDVIPAHVFEPADFGDAELDSRVQLADWDGFSFSFPEERSLMVVLNPNRPIARRTATLMEELAHHLLGHAPSAIWRDKATGVLRRDFDKSQEDEAYDLGAALLLPKERIQLDVSRRTPARQIAMEHSCSVPLVEYRIKRLRLWKRYTS
jgi:Zn-dependent peptidase ImmA (M78 family)